MTAQVRAHLNSKVIQYYLPASDARALDWIAAHAPPGGVLSPTPFAVIIPSQTGRAVWVGQGYWSRDYPARARQVDRLFGGKLHRRRARVHRLHRRAHSHLRLPAPLRLTHALAGELSSVNSLAAPACTSYDG